MRLFRLIGNYFSNDRISGGHAMAKRVHTQIVSKQFEFEVAVMFKLAEFFNSQVRITIEKGGFE